MSTTETSHADVKESSAGRLTDATLLKIWGAVVTAGWVVSQTVALSGTTSDQLQFGLTAFWLVGSLVPIGASFWWMRTRSFTGLFPVWTVLGVTGLIASFIVIAEIVDVAPVLILGALWFAGPAVGFLVTAWYMNDWSKKLYAGAAVANLAGAVAVLVVPGFVAVYYLVAAVVQGLPMLYHGVKLNA